MPNDKRNLSKLARAAARPPEKSLSNEEQLEACLRHLLHIEDPVAFCIDRLKFEPEPWQARLLRSRSLKILVNVARQQGKSTTAAAKALHRAIMFPKSVILIVAPAIKQAAELRRKVDDFLLILKGVDAKPDVKNKEEIEFSNGSRIIILAADEDTVRSYTADMIIEDESATVPEGVHQAMSPMLDERQGQHLLLGTPKGMRKHHFPDIWFDTESTWEKYEITAWQNTRRPNNKERLIERRAELERLGRLWWFEQEYECSFVAAAQGLVYPFDRKKNLTPSLPRDDRFWQYVLGIDYGFNDSTAYVVLGWQQDDPHVYVVESIEKRGLLAPEAAQIALELTKKYPFARMVGDMGGFGKGYVEEARRRFRLPIVAAEKNNKRGYIELMASDMRAGLLKVFPGNEGLIDEWAKLPWDEEREMPAEGYKDHLADAALYAWRAAAHFLEEVRKAKPKKGTPEAYELEAKAIFDRHLQTIARKKKDEDIEWWDESESASESPFLEQMNQTSFLN